MERKFTSRFGFIVGGEASTNSAGCKISFEANRNGYTTVYVVYLPREIHEACDKRLGAGDDPETGETRRNMAPHRRLSLACVSPAIEDFTAGMRHQSVQDINTWVTRYDDYGATAYIAATRAGLQYAIYQVSSPPSRMASGGCWQHLVSAS